MTRTYSLSKVSEWE